MAVAMGNHGSCHVGNGSSFLAGKGPKSVKEHVGPQVFTMQELMSSVGAWVSLRFVSKTDWHILF